MSEMKRKPRVKALIAERVRSAAGVDQLEARIAALEAEVREHDSTHLRFAELVDLVQELLLPMAQQDQAKVQEAVARFTDELDQ